MKKNFQTYFYSVLGVIALLLIVIAFNVITATMKVRVDLTKEKAYTLSAGTRAILAKLDTPVTLRFYYSSSAELTQNTLFLKAYAQRVQDLLAEYKQASKGKLIILNYNPKPESDAEDSAQLDGVEGQMLPNGEKFYLGISVSMLDAKQAIPFLVPTRERQLEYDISRAISQVMTPDKPVVGIMSPLPVLGSPNAAMMMRMGQQTQEPWTIVEELKNDFTVKPIEMTADKIDDDVKVLVVIHPKGITDATQYAIDQFIMRGGKLVAFLDGTSLVDRRSDNPMMAQMPGGCSSLDKLLTAWGLHFDMTKVAADMNYKMRFGGRNGQPTEAPAVLAVTGDGINKDDVATSEIGDAWLPLCGVFTGTPVAGLKETVLLKTTKDSQLVEGMLASFGGDNILKDFKPSGTEYALAVRLAGKFKTAFPEGKPKEAKPDEKAPAEKPAEGLKECKTDNSVVLFGDADFISDQFAIEKQNILGMALVRPLNGNLTLAQNVIEQMAGDSDLIGVRSRAVQSRPLTRIHEMEAKAEEASQGKVKELEDSMRETQEKLNELQRNKDQGQQRFIMSPEQQAELDKIKKKRADTMVALKQEQKKLTRDKESLENWLKWSNILVMPGVVTLSGIGLAIFKKKRTSAK
jgi:ABC-type uncharacterized transport system involved in gliding motility auxiliary subunit